MRLAEEAANAPSCKRQNLLKLAFSTHRPVTQVIHRHSTRHTLLLDSSR